VVKAGKLTYVGADGTEQTLDWDNDAVGQYWQEVVFQQKKVKPGDRFHFLGYDLMLPGSFTVHVAVKESEKVDRLVPKKEGKTIKVVREPATLLRVETVPGKIMVNGTPVQLPIKTVWLDSKLTPVRELFQMPGLGTVTLYRTTKEAAL